MKAEMSADGNTIVVSIPVVWRRRGGRKLIIAPDGIEMAPPAPRDDTLARLVAKAHHWLRLLETGKAPSIQAIAEQENIDKSYAAKVLRLTLLAPDIVLAILDGRQPDVLTWRELARPFPVLWTEQRQQWGMTVGK